jgi:PIN domain nuclease of toxin-antitoxin system
MVIGKFHLRNYLMMKYLIDTHVFIWSQTQTSELSQTFIDVFEDVTNEIYYSAVSLWEIKIKNSIGKLDCNYEKLNLILDKANSQSCKFLSLEYETLISFNLPIHPFHKDPFDRMLIWQAIHHNYTLVSRDKKFKLYEDITSLKLLW